MVLGTLHICGEQVGFYNTKSKTRGGFTFVELMVAAAMMGILFVGLGSHLRGGIAVWRRTTKVTEALQKERVAVDQLERDLSNAFTYYDVASGSELGLPEPRFLESSMQWYTAKPATFYSSASVQLVTYECGEYNGKQSLLRTGRSVSEERSKAEIVPRMILPGCESLSVSYAYLPKEGTSELYWRSDWKDKHGNPPRLIRVAFQLASTEKESGKTIERTFAIPSGLLKAYKESEGLPSP